jgi:CHAD domain-containing protein
LRSKLTVLVACTFCRKLAGKELRQGDDEAFHKWHIRVKNLYYELQMLQPVWPERLVKMVADLRQLEEKIGADHDLVVLKQSLLKTPDAFGGIKAVESAKSLLAGGATREVPALVGRSSA